MNRNCTFSFVGVSVKDHFGSDAFSANGRMFLTVRHEKNEVHLMLNREQQNQFLEIDGEGFNPLENLWGEHAIMVQLDFVDREVFANALNAAWVNSANKRTRAGKTKTPRRSAK